MESLPAEVLDNILSFVHDRDTLRSCRLVSHRWNTVTTPFLRPCFSTVIDMDQYVELYRAFPNNRYNSVCFTKLSDGVTAAAVRLLRTCTALIKDVKVVFDFNTPISSDNFQRFLGALDSEVLPNLRVLSFVGALNPACAFDDLCASSQLSMRRLTTLRLIFHYHQDGFGKFATALVDAAPNLKYCEAALLLNLTQSFPEPFWPFPERFRPIPTLGLRLKVTRYVHFGERVSEIAAKLAQWTNIRVTKVVLGHGMTRALMPEVRGLMEGVLGQQAANVKGLTLKAGPRVQDLDPCIHLLPLVALETLTVSGNGAALLWLPIPENSLRALHRVTVRGYVEENQYFRQIAFDSVKVFRLQNPIYRKNSCAPGRFTPWAHVFPNLETLAVVRAAHVGRTPNSIPSKYNGAPMDAHFWLDLSLVEYLLAHMRMRTLKSVAYALGNRIVAAPILPEANEYIGNVFSGFDNLEGVVKGAKEAHDEEEYWAHRRPCIANLEGLERFQFDYPIDDAFATGILLLMKPLNLTICSKNLSKAMLEKVAAHHKSLCSTSHGLMDTDSI